MHATRICFTASLLLLGAALLLGGGQQPLAAMAVELVSLAVLAILMLVPARRAPSVDMRFAYGLLGACVALPLLQLVPLPPALWQALPGRESAAAIGALAGQAGRWRPLSLDPEMTRGCALALLPAAAMFLATLDTNARERRTLALIAGAGALVSAALGVAQVASGSQTLYPYETAHFGLPVGLFANRNHQADLLLVAALLLVGVAHRYRADLAMRVTTLGVIGFLALTIVVTRSRTAMLLMVATLPPAALLVTDRRRLGWRPALIALGVIAAAGALLATSATIQASLARFGAAGSDLRFGVWSDSGYAALRYFPAGAGGGTFVPIFATVEPLTTLTFENVNHAHDDYIELLLEYGLPGVLLLVGYGVLVLRQLVRAAEPGERLPRALGALAMLVLLLHSLTDYPLRNPALLVVFAMLNAMLFAPVEETRKRARNAVSKRRSAA